MTQQRAWRGVLLALAIVAAFAGFSAAPAAAAADKAGGAAIARIDGAVPAGDAKKAQPITVRSTVRAKDSGATTNAPLAGFCTFNGVSGATSYITCSLAIPATVYVYCSNGNIFYGYLSYPGVYSLSATPCYATGYNLV